MMMSNAVMICQRTNYVVRSQQSSRALASMETYKVGTVRSKIAPGRIELAVDPNGEDGGKDPRSGKAEDAVGGAVVTRGRSQGQIDEAETAFGQVDGDEVEDIACEERLHSNVNSSSMHCMTCWRPTF